MSTGNLYKIIEQFLPKEIEEKKNVVYHVMMKQKTWQSNRLLSSYAFSINGTKYDTNTANINIQSNH